MKPQCILSGSRISDTDLHLADQTTIVSRLQSAHKELITHQKKHIELRATHLEELAEAIILHHSETIIQDQSKTVDPDKVLKILKQLKFREHALGIQEDIKHP
jgi:hypothetical protein